MIYPVTQSSGPSKISVVLDTTLNNRTRDWRMKIYQYECSSPNLAPSGCLQYFTQASGQFTSFNYKTTVNSGDGPNHLANLNYAICFRIENGFCGIKYSQDPSDNFSFTISEDSSNLGAKLTDIQKVKYSDVNCKRDYVLIPGGSETGLNQDQKYSFDRFCGSTLGVCGLKNPQDVQCSPIISPVQSMFLHNL